MKTLSEYLKVYSTISSKFIDQFFSFHDFNLSYDEIYINFDQVVSYLNMRKSDLKETLVKNYTKKVDYTVKIEKLNTLRGRPSEIILISPDCFRRLCMISRTKKSEEVRSYFIELEKHLNKFKDYIINEQNKKINILKNNQKPFINPKSGVVYVLKTELDIEGVYKIGKTTNFKKRLNTHNSSHPDNVEIMLVYETDNIDEIERCIKNFLQKTQYRNKKEFYQIDLDILKKLLTGCEKLSLIASSTPKSFNKKEELFCYLKKN